MLISHALLILSINSQRPESGDLVPPITNYLVSVDQHRSSSWKQANISVSSSCGDFYRWEMTVPENNKMYTVLVKSNNSVGTSNNSVTSVIGET